MMSQIHLLTLDCQAKSKQTYPTTITADELTEGDIVLHLGSHIQVISEPEYTNSGIEFEVLWLDVEAIDNTQEVSFHPSWRFELVSHVSPSSQELEVA